MKIRPITLRAAAAFVSEHHRHNKAPRGHKWSIGLWAEEPRSAGHPPRCDGPCVLRKTQTVHMCETCRTASSLIGVATVSRPIARALDNGLNAEITRTCTNGRPNANSKLYGAALRGCKAMGYHKVYTYTQEGETGASLRAVGFVVDAVLKPRGSWVQCSTSLKHKRDGDYHTGGVARVRWVIVFEGNA